jgi:protein-tyrosine phosphatase
MNPLNRVLRRLPGRHRRFVADLLDRRAGTPPSPTGATPEYRIMFVCYGNSCRSPLAHGIVRDRLARAGLLGRVTVESAGTHAADTGAPPDPRARRVARRHGISIGDLRARRFDREDFDRFDRIVVFDGRNLEAVLALARDGDDRAKVVTLLANGDVFDPVYGPYSAFERTFEQVAAAAEDLVGELHARLEHR